MWSRLPVGLVADEKHGIVGQGTGDGYSLLLAAGEQVRRLFRLVRHVEALQLRHCLVTSLLPPVNAGKVHRHHDVFQDGQRGHELEELEHDADVARAPACELALACGRDIHAVHDHDAGRRPVNARNHVQKRGLPTAGRAYQGNEIPSSDL